MYGLSGSWNTTDCSNSSYTFIYSADLFYSTSRGVLTGQYNFMAPYYKFFDALIALTNMQVACMFPE